MGLRNVISGRHVTAGLELHFVRDRSGGAFLLRFRVAVGKMSII